MARKTKPSTRSSTAKKKATSTKARPTAKAAAKRKPGSGKSRGSEVETRWADYLDQRTELEAAVEAVRIATEQLSSARAVEATRRKQFDECKQTLERLLEVDAVSGSRNNPRTKAPGFPEPARTPVISSQHEAKQG